MFPRLPLSPYAVQNGELFQIWRLYNDDNLALLQSVWPVDATSGYVLRPLEFTFHDFQIVNIQLFRTRARAPGQQQLDGVRMASQRRRLERVGVVSSLRVDVDAIIQ
jgi:hypothetical protein